MVFLKARQSPNSKSSRACPRLRCRFPDKNKLHLRRLHESAGCVFPWQAWLWCWLPMCFAWQQMSCSDLGKSRRPLLVPTGRRWTGDCDTLQLLHQCCQLDPGGVPLEPACARFVTWGKNCCANQVNNKNPDRDALGLFWSQKTYIFQCSSSLWRTTGSMFHCF